MSIIERPTSRPRTSSSRAHTGTAAVETLGGQYVSAAERHARIGGSYVSTGSTSVPGTHGTYVTTPSPTPRAGGSYTYVS